MRSRQHLKVHGYESAEQNLARRFLEDFSKRKGIKSKDRGRIDYSSSMMLSSLLTAGRKKSLTHLHLHTRARAHAHAQTQTHTHPHVRSVQAGTGIVTLCTSDAK